MISYDAHRWRDHFFDYKGSLLRDILPRVYLTALWSAVVVGFNLYVYPIGIPSTLHTLVGMALGLLLVFRTNASYDRFWEGRKAWGGIVNECRNLARIAEVLIAPKNPELYRRLLRWTAAFPFTTMVRLRGALGHTSDLGRTVCANEFDRAASSSNPPLTASIEMSRAIDEAKREGLITDYLQGTMDQNVQLLIDYFGACERIQRTPLPFAYVVHLRRAMVLYCGTLPFALVQSQGWITVLETLFVAFIYFGIEEIGVEIENPFGNDDNDLPLETICQTIETDLASLLDSKKESSA